MRKWKQCAGCSGGSSNAAEAEAVLETSEGSMEQKLTATLHIPPPLPSRRFQYFESTEPLLIYTASRTSKTCHLLSFSHVKSKVASSEILFNKACQEN